MRPKACLARWAAFAANRPRPGHCRPAQHLQRRARQARHLQPKHDAGVTEGDLGDQVLEPVAVARLGAGLINVAAALARLPPGWRAWVAMGVAVSPLHLALAAR